MTKGHRGRISYFFLFGHFLANLKSPVMIGREAKVGVSYRNGMAAMKNEFFTWKDIREIPTLLGFSRNRRAEDIKSNCGQHPNSSKSNLA